MFKIFYDIFELLSVLSVQIVYIADFSVTPLFKTNVFEIYY